MQREKNTTAQCACEIEPTAKKKLREREKRTQNWQFRRRMKTNDYYNDMYNIYIGMCNEYYAFGEQFTIYKSKTQRYISFECHQIKSILNWLELCDLLKKNIFASNADSNFHLNHLRFVNFLDDFLFGSFGILVLCVGRRKLKNISHHFCLGHFWRRQKLAVTKLETKGYGKHWMKKKYETHLQREQSSNIKRSTKFNESKIIA